MSIEVRHISKAFGEFVALENISLTISNRGARSLTGPVWLWQNYPATRHCGIGKP